jgi:hypothetical protein
MPTASPIKTVITGKDELSKKMDEIQKRVKKFSDSTKRIGRSLTRNLTLPMAAAGGISLKFATDFNEGMANVATLIPGNLKRVKQLKGEILDLSKATGKSTQDLTEGLYQTISAFQDSEETMERLRIATKAGMAGRAETIESLKMLSAITKGYGDTSIKAMKQTSDFAFSIVKLGETTFPDLASSIGSTVPLADALGVDLKQLSTAFATMTGPMGNAAETSTKIRGIFTAVIKQTGGMEKIIKKLGLGFTSASNAMKKMGMRPFLQLMKIATSTTKDKNKALKELGFSSFKAMKKSLGLIEATEKMSDVLKVNQDRLGKVFTRQEGLIGVTALLGGLTDAYAKKTKLMNNVTGATTEAFKEQTEGINKAGQEFKEAKAEMIALAIKIGDKLIPVATRFLKTLMPIIDKISKLDDDTFEWGLKLAGLTMLIGPLVTGVGIFAGSLTNIIGLLSKTKAGTLMVIKSVSALKTQFAGGAKAAGKFATATGIIGGVTAAGTAGYAVGSLISGLVLEPIAEEKYRTFEDIANVRRRAQEAIRLGKGPAEQLKALRELRIAGMKLPETVNSFESGMGTIASIFTDVESPLEKIKRESEKMADAQKRLIESLNKTARNLETKIPEMKGGIETKTITKESKLTVELSNLPPGTTMRTQGAPLKKSARGVIME